MIISRKKRIIAAVLAMAALVFLLPVGADAVTQEEIDALKAERDAIAAERNEQQAIVDSLLEAQEESLAMKRALEERNALALEQIQINDEQIALYDDMIAEKADELELAKTLEAEQLARYRRRVRAMEETGTYEYIILLLQSRSISELLSAIDDIGDIMESDKRLEDEYIAAREHTEEVKAEYEAAKAEVEAVQAELRAEQEALAAEIAETNAYLATLEAQLAANEEVLAEIDAAWDDANDAVNAMIAELQAQKAAEAAANRPAYAAANAVQGTGSFMWPCPSCTYITSRVGNRLHPISGVYKNHTGLDIGAQAGATVLAADGGTVTIAYYYGGYGNCVMIDHGNGYFTLYGHLSSINVSQNQNVGKGDCVGYVGSTGNSTGPHLHFEIRKGTTILDPENFYNTSAFTYSPDAGE